MKQIIQTDVKKIRSGQPTPAGAAKKSEKSHISRSAQGH